ncbi:MAG: Na/Pi symporter, partial [Promethearchaeota archaeon]
MGDFNLTTLLFSIIGGLGLFIFGLRIMGDGLQKAAGQRMREIISHLTNNRYIGVGLGALVTSVVQSSSATTVMVVGFVNAGLMTLLQAIPIIFGANIGTTVTAQLI